MTILYYEAKGETETKLMEMLNARRKAINALDKWAKRFGGRIATDDSRWGFRCVLAFPKKSKIQEPTQDRDHWKQDKHGQWRPRLSTKRGKELSKEMSELSNKVKGVSYICDYLKIPFASGSFSATGGFYMASVGLYPQKSGRLLLAIKCRKYKPPKGILMTRISDLDFTKLTGEEL